jgi:peroxiredoxin family protein/TusA-related sulfurtransferase
MAEGSAQTIDCRGMQGAALFAELTKAIKKQTTLPTKLEILATDENFPAEIEDWSKVSKHRVENIEKREDGVFAAQLYIEDTRPKSAISTNPSRANLIVKPAVAISTTAETNTNIPVPEAAPEAEAEPPPIPSEATRIEAAPTKSSKAADAEKKPEPPKPEVKSNTPTAPPPPKSQVAIPIPQAKSQSNLVVVPSTQKSQANPVVIPAAQKSSARIELPPAPKSNARIDINLLNKSNVGIAIPPAAKSVARIEIPKELLSTAEEEPPKESSVVAPLPQESTRIEAAPQKSKPVAIVPPEPESVETDSNKMIGDNDPSIVSPLPSPPRVEIEIPPQPSGGYATTPPPQPIAYNEEEEDFQSRESMTETGMMMSDLSGMPAERAILHLSTLVLNANNGPLQVISDAPGFDEKLRGWSQLANIFIQDLQSDGTRTNALLIIGQPAPAPNQTQPVPITSAKPSNKENHGSLCVIKNSPESLFAAVMMANAAAAKGAQVDILLYSFGVELLRTAPPATNPIKKLLQKILAWITPNTLKQLDFKNPLSESLGYRLQTGESPSVGQILQSANKERVRFYVCATSLGLAKLAPFDMLKVPNMEVVELALFTENAKNSSFSFTF